MWVEFHSLIVEAEVLLLLTNNHKDIYKMKTSSK